MVNFVGSMNNLINQHFPFLFPVFFIAMWLIVTSILGVLSGWYLLMQKYPDRKEDELLRLKYQSGLMGLWVGMRGILNIGVCPSGLRIGIMRIFGIFCRDFFVPWEEIRVERKNQFFWQRAELQFGNPVVGRLSISSHVADRLARSAQGHWPEAGPFPEETSNQIFLSIGKQWVGMTFLAALFFIVVPRIATPKGPYPPILVAILFPAVVFGIVSLFRYISRTKR
jgi:hypothetical protein